MSVSRDCLSRGHIGLHEVTAETNGVLRLVMHGVITARDATEFREMLVDYGKHHPGYEIIAFVNDMTGIDGGARREFVQSVNPYLFRCCYLVGASFTVRTIIMGIHRARRVLRPNAARWAIEVVATEQEARQRIAVRKREHSIAT